MQEFTTALAGAITAGVIDAVIEANASKWFPQWDNKPLFVEPLPPVDDWLVLGISLIPVLAGKYVLKNKRGRQVKQFGLGMVLYSAAMIVHHVIIRASWMVPQAASYVARQQYRQQRYGGIPVNITVSG